MRSITFVAALLGAASATPTSIGSPDSIAHATCAADSSAADKARLILNNNFASQQKVYIVGRHSGRQAFINKNGCIVYASDMHSPADLDGVAITLAPNQRDLPVDVLRPFTTGRVYASETNVYFNIHGEQIGHPYTGPNPNEAEATRFNFVDIQVEVDLDTMSGAVHHSDFIGTPSMGISIQNSNDGEVSAQGYRSDCVKDFCERASDADRESCVYKDNIPLRIFAPRWSLSQQQQACGQDLGHGIVVVRNAKRMTITVG